MSREDAWTVLQWKSDGEAVVYDPDRRDHTREAVAIFIVETRRIVVRGSQELRALLEPCRDKVTKAVAIAAYGRYLREQSRRRRPTQRPKKIKRKQNDPSRKFGGPPVDTSKMRFTKCHGCGRKLAAHKMRKCTKCRWIQCPSCHSCQCNWTKRSRE